MSGLICSFSSPFCSDVFVLEVFEEVEVLEVLEDIRSTALPPVVVHSSLETFGGSRSTCSLPLNLHGLEPSASWSSPGVGTSFCLHHPEKDEVVQPHHVGRSPWVLPHLEDDHLLHLQACKMESSHRHLVEVVAEGLEVVLEG